MVSETVNTVIAVSLAAVSSITQAIGYVVQKKGHNQVNEINEKAKTEEEKTSYLKNCLWVTGFIIYVVGSILNAAALKFGAQSVVAPLGALTLVANTILATRFLGEPFDVKTDSIGIILVIIGSVLAVVFGPKSEGGDPSLTELQDLYGQTAFLVFFLILTGLAIADFIGVKYFERKNFTSDENNKIVEGRTFLMISYVALAAYFGSFNVLMMKSLVIILTTFTVDHFKTWLLYVVIVGTVLVNVLLEFFRQRALAYFGALFVVPIYQVLLIVGASMMGAVYFNEFAGMEGYELALFVIAIIITLGGVSVLAFNVGKYLDKFEEFIEVAFIKESAMLENHTSPEFPVWGGLYSKLVQQFYLRNDPFCLNQAIENIQEVIDKVDANTPAAIKNTVDKIEDKMENLGK